MLPPKTPRLASLEHGETHLHSARIQLCRWEKKTWPFRGYMPSETGGVTCTAHWTDRRVIIEPEKVGLMEKLVTAVLLHFLEQWNPLVGKRVSGQVKSAQEFANTAHEGEMFFSIPHSVIEKYQPYNWYVQIVPEDSVNDAETFCFAVWEIDSSTPRVKEIIELGNKLIIASRA